MNIKLLLRSKLNNKIVFIRKAFTYKDKFKLLDVGSGNGSATKIKSLFNFCEYFGLDIDKTTNYVSRDFELMEKFYEMDLTKLDFEEIPNAYFDYINMAHVMEHLHNGDLVLQGLLQKLKPGGYFYIEYPGDRSLDLPSMNGTLNFYDDSTHVRIYSVSETEAIFLNNNCEVISSDTRKNWYCIAAIPFRLLHNLFTWKKPSGNTFWDLLGFAEYVFVKRN